MGHLRFGTLFFMRNIIYVQMSPFEQKAFPNFLANTWRGFRRDVTNNVPYMAPPFLTGYLVYVWAKNEHERLTRKNPKDYENDC